MLSGLDLGPNIVACRADGALEAHNLSDDVAMFVLERSFARLVRERQRIAALAPMLREFVGTGAAANTVVSAPPQQPAQQGLEHKRRKRYQQQLARKQRDRAAPQLQRRAAGLPKCAGWATPPSPNSRSCKRRPTASRAAR